MALEVEIRKMTMNFLKEKKSKYVAAANRGRVIETEHLIEQISLRCGVHRTQVAAVMETMVESMNVFLNAGHGVRLKNVGTFLPAVVSRSADEIEDTGIRRVKVSFRPSKSLRKVMSSIPISTHIGGDIPKSNAQESSSPSAGTTGEGGTFSGGGIEMG